jgi:hypothetical protein
MAKDERKGCLFGLLGIFGGGSAAGKREKQLPYRAKRYFFSKAERSFFGVLHQAAGNQYAIFAKVRLSDLLYVKKGTESRQGHFNRIQSKHVDFVLCDPEQVRPALVIELDDASHGRSKRQKRDAFVDRSLTAGGLPILRVPAKRNYDSNGLAQSIRNAIRP